MSAFAHDSRGTIQRPRQLAQVLAVRAGSLRRLAARQLAVEEARGVGEMLALRAAFSTSLAGQDDFVDAFAQTLVHGLLAARWWSGGETFTREAAARLLPATSPDLSAILLKIVGARFEAEVERVVDEVVGLLACTDVRAVFAGQEDPVIHFYEEFLDVYDPRLRRERGVYYTPDEVVAYVVNTSHAALQERFGLRLGLADAVTWGELSRARGWAVPEGVSADAAVVQILDPATGTGTFLLRVMGVIHATMMAEYEGAGWDAARCVEAWRGYVREHLLPRIFGFELLVAPCVICHLRLALALERTGFVFGGGADERLRVVRADTLQIGEEEGEGAWVKRRAPISVIVGNPPYEREAAGDDGAHKGGWMLDGWSEWNEGVPPIEDFDGGARLVGAGGNLQTTRNSYYYFWRWALWRVFEAGPGIGVLALVTASSYLRGPGFCGLRGHVRGVCSEAYILDLEGDRLGTRISENVFEITIPVCVATVLRIPGGVGAGRIFYARAVGTRADKLALCAGISSLSRHAWGEVDGARFEPFIAGGAGDYAAWCPLVDVFPVRFTGYHFYRTWPIGETREVLERRWDALLQAPVESRAKIIKETRDRKVVSTYGALFGGERGPAIAALEVGSERPVVMRTSFRSFDRKWCIADSRVGDFLRPALWRTWGPRQVYMTSLLSGVIGDGPAATAAGYVPDCHHFRGSYGGKDVVPLWCDAAGERANVAEAVMAALAGVYGYRPAAEDVFAYAYAVLANPGYVRRFKVQLQIPGPRLPLTADFGLFAEGAALGRRLLRWHTYGERFADAGDGVELGGSARVLVAIPETVAGYPARHRYDAGTRVLHVGEGQVGPVSGEVMGLSVSGLQVVKSWLDHRMARGAGRRSSALDAIRPERWTPESTRELLELLWVLERTIAAYPALDEWLDAVLAGTLLTADEVVRGAVDRDLLT